MSSMINSAYGEHPTKASLAIVEALCNQDTEAVTDKETILYDHVDPDALDHLFTHTNGTVDSVKFTIDDAMVSVWKDETVHARIHSG